MLKIKRNKMHRTLIIQRKNLLQQLGQNEQMQEQVLQAEGRRTRGRCICPLGNAQINDRRLVASRQVH